MFELNGSQRKALIICSLNGWIAKRDITVAESGETIAGIHHSTIDALERMVCIKPKIADLYELTPVGRQLIGL
ncbi:MAG: hypothetical protein WC734_06080 [Patescibacteria group bacterium]|jgi:hypothetical protein